MNVADDWKNYLLGLFIFLFVVLFALRGGVSFDDVDYIMPNNVSCANIDSSFNRVSFSGCDDGKVYSAVESYEPYVKDETHTKRK